MRSFLARLDAVEIEKLLGWFERVPVEHGDILIEEGATEHTFFVVVRGQFEVVKAGRVLRVMEGGQVFGELSFFDAAPRSASVRASSEGEVLRVTESCFARIRQHDPDLAVTLALEVGRALSERFRQREHEMSV